MFFSCLFWEIKALNATSSVEVGGEYEHFLLWLSQMEALAFLYAYHLLLQLPMYGVKEVLRALAGGPALLFSHLLQG